MPPAEIPPNVELDNKSIIFKHVRVGGPHGPRVEGAPCIAPRAVFCVLQSIFPGIFRVAGRLKGYAYNSGGPHSVWLGALSRSHGGRALRGWGGFTGPVRC